MPDHLTQPQHITPPFWLLAELTYECPLHCVFCYNPVDYSNIGKELTTEQWLDVLEQARELGAVQLGLSGGEPLRRRDLETIVEHAHHLGYYTNLLTSGVGLTEERLDRLQEAGLDHIQLSFQDSTRELNDFLSNTRTFDLKCKTARMIKSRGYPMVMNCVLHRLNLPHVDQIIDMAVEMGADYLELANTQYYGWALLNRDALLPTAKELLEAERVVNEKRRQIGDKCEILFVVPDYYENRPKACMSGWGSIFLVVASDGAALPCHAARELPGLTFPDVRSESLYSIWYESQAFNEYRGTEWMKDPCRSCSERHKDFGGCRCQAYLLTGDARNADPVCSLSPYRYVVDEAIEKAKEHADNIESLKFRTNPPRVRPRETT